MFLFQVCARCGAAAASAGVLKSVGSRFGTQGVKANDERESSCQCLSLVASHYG